MKEREKFMFYSHLTREEKRKIIIKGYSKGEILEVLNRNTMKFFYFILKGRIKINKDFESKLVSSCLSESDGYLIGSMIFYANLNLDLDLISNSNNLRVMKIPVEIIERLKRESLEFNSFLYKNSMDIFVGQQEKLHTQSIYGIRGRIAYVFMKEYETDYIYIENQNNFIEDLNIGKDGFYNTINYFLEEKIIEKEKNSIKILDRNKLKSLYFDFLR